MTITKIVLKYKYKGFEYEIFENTLVDFTWYSVVIQIYEKPKTRIEGVEVFEDRIEWSYDKLEDIKESDFTTKFQNMELEKVLPKIIKDVKRVINDIRN